MSIILNGTTGITTPDIQSAAGLDATDINDNAITAAKLHTTAVTDKLGYTPVNKAGCHTGKKWFNNGEYENLYVPGQEPDGFMKGRKQTCQK